MLGAIKKALEEIRDRRQRKWRHRLQLKSSVLLLSLLAFPVWWMLRTEPTEPTCPGPGTVEAAGAPRGDHPPSTSGSSSSPAIPSMTIDSPPSNSTPPALVEPTPPTTSEVVLLETAEEPPPRPVEAAPELRKSSAPVRPTSRSRSALHRALMKCKPHSTARIEVAVNPGMGVEIDGDRPTGELGRCVEEVVAAHSPKKAETIHL